MTHVVMALLLLALALCIVLLLGSRAATDKLRQISWSVKKYIGEVMATAGLFGLLTYFLMTTAQPGLAFKVLFLLGFLMGAVELIHLLRISRGSQPWAFNRLIFFTGSAAVIALGLMVSGCDHSPPTAQDEPVTFQPLVIDTDYGQVQIVNVIYSDSKMTLEINCNRGPREISIENQSNVDEQQIVKRISAGDGYIALTERFWISDDTYEYRSLSNGVELVTVEIWDGNQPQVRYSNEHNEVLLLDGYSVTKPDEAKLRQAMYRIRGFLPLSNPLVNNQDYLLMTTILEDGVVQDLMFLNASGVMGTAGSNCPRRLTIAAGLGVRFGCKFMAVPNPWISVPAATACIAGHGFFWGCLFLEAYNGDHPDNDNNNQPPPPPPPPPPPSGGN